MSLRCVFQSYLHISLLQTLSDADEHRSRRGRNTCGVKRFSVFSSAYTSSKHRTLWVQISGLSVRKGGGCPWTLPHARPCRNYVPPRGSLGLHRCPVVLADAPATGPGVSGARTPVARPPPERSTREHATSRLPLAGDGVLSSRYMTRSRSLGC